MEHTSCKLIFSGDVSVKFCDNPLKMFYLGVILKL